MGTLKEKLEYIADTKDAIKDAIEAKGVTVASTATFRDYADKIGEISSGGPFAQYSITVKATERYATGSGSGYQTRTYTFDESGFYFIGFSSWDASSAVASSMTYSGTYTVYHTASSKQGVTQTNIAYIEAGTVVTFYIYSRWQFTYVVCKLNGMQTIGTKLTEFVDGANTLTLDFSTLSSNKDLVCIYYTSGESGTYHFIYPENYATALEYSPMVIWDQNNAGSTGWGAEGVGVIFFKENTIDSIRSVVTNYSTRIYQIFEIE